MNTATLPNHHRFSRAYKPRTAPITLLGICPCGCGERVTDNYQYVECNDEYFVDTDHFMKYHGAEVIG